LTSQDPARIDFINKNIWR